MNATAIGKYMKIRIKLLNKVSIKEMRKKDKLAKEKLSP